MRYKFRFKTTAADIWQLAMYHIYGSMVGLCNIIFTAAMILLSVSYWHTVSLPLRLLMIAGCLLFSVLQPLFIYLRASRQAAGIAGEVELGFDDGGVRIKSGKDSLTLSWKQIKRVSRKPTLLIIYTDTKHGFILNNRTLGTDRDAFYQYLLAKMAP